jgi:DNA-directed RNA polymerase III subunit RPC1
MELTEKHYTKGTGVMCPVDGMVVIRGSELLCGNLCKGTLGGSAHGLVSTLIRDYSPHEASVALNRLAKLSARWIGDRGFSVGIDDVTPSLRLQEQRRERFSIGYDDCKVQIDKFLDGKLEAQAGLTDEQTLEGLMVSKLSVIREDLGSSCLRELDYLHNGPLIMAVCGSKGSALNISQMVVGVGQQTVSSQRIAYGFVNRTLPHFPKFSLDPDARGFVENSFYSGLTATEFFFHTMGGREGLVDTAVKTVLLHPNPLPTSFPHHPPLLTPNPRLLLAPIARLQL